MSADPLDPLIDRVRGGHALSRDDADTLAAAFEALRRTPEERLVELVVGFTATISSAVADAREAALRSAASAEESARAMTKVSDAVAESQELLRRLAKAEAERVEVENEERRAELARRLAADARWWRAVVTVFKAPQFWIGAAVVGSGLAGAIRYVLGLEPKP